MLTVYTLGIPVSVLPGGWNRYVPRKRPMKKKTDCITKRDAATKYDKQPNQEAANPNGWHRPSDDAYHLGDMIYML